MMSSFPGIVHCKRGLFEWDGDEDVPYYRSKSDDVIVPGRETNTWKFSHYGEDGPWTIEEINNFVEAFSFGRS